MAWDGSNRVSRLPKNWQAIRTAILRRDNYACQMRVTGCLGHANEVDHINPGDDHSYSNLRAVCSWCHGKKSAQEGNAARRARFAANRRPAESHPGML